MKTFKVTNGHDKKVLCMKETLVYLQKMEKDEIVLIKKIG